MEAPVFSRKAPPHTGGLPARAGSRAISYGSPTTDFTRTVGRPTTATTADSTPAARATPNAPAAQHAWHKLPRSCHELCPALWAEMSGRIFLRQ